jgi:release factor glutamine methyltransferase
MTRAADALAALRERLRAISPTAALDAEVLLAMVLGTGRAALAADPDRTLDAAQSAALESLVIRRLAGEPVAYLAGQREFWSLELEVTPDVLVPRPETELLVDLALAAISRLARPSVLDLGTGSGAIALAIAAERKDASVTATDISPAALAVASRNADRHGIRNIRLVQGSWYEPLAGARFDAIVSNPPYVESGDPALAALAHEPRLALAAGPRGLEAIEAVCAGAGAHLALGGHLLIEHAADQGAAVRGLMKAAGLGGVETHRDLAMLERVTAGAMPPEALELSR